MSKGSGGGTSTTVQKADPWLGAQPYISDVLSNASTAFRNPPAFFPGNTVGPEAAETIQAQQMAAGRAIAGSPELRSAQAQNRATTEGQFFGLNPALPQFGLTAQGAYLGANPMLNAMLSRATDPLVQQFSKAVLPGITSQFALGGRYGSNAHQEAINMATGNLGRTLSDTAVGIYGPAYESERNRMLQAAGGLSDAFGRERQLMSTATALAPQLAEADFTDPAKLAAVGEARQDRAQALINDAIARWNFSQNLPWAQLQNYNQLVQGGLGAGGTQTGTQTLPDTRNRLSGALGGGALGYGLGSSGMIGGLTGGWGALLGAMLGAMG